MSNFRHLTKQQWVCRICMKSLSSKRSFDEHMNIHNKSRPFACDECDYAAASQMTLRRHKLRNHVPRSHWGYLCPYCREPYMEPASYQQHVIARHWGLSATFGCPYRGCTFTSKSSRFFREHLCKHQMVLVSKSSPDYASESTFNLGSEESLAIYLINDECGSGNNNSAPHSGRRLIRRTNDLHENIVPRRHQYEPTVVHRFIYSTAVKYTREEKAQEIQQFTINVEDLLDEEERVEREGRQQQKYENYVLSHKSVAPRTKPYYYLPQTDEPVKSFEQNVVENTQEMGSQLNAQENLIEWIEAEVVIDDRTPTFSKILDGQTDEFGLD